MNHHTKEDMAKLALSDLDEARERVDKARSLVATVTMEPGQPSSDFAFDEVLDYLAATRLIVDILTENTGSPTVRGKIDAARQLIRRKLGR